eukprot:79095_1
MALVLLSVLLPRMTSAGCHTGGSDSGIPTLSLITQDVSHGGTNSAVYGRVLSGASKPSAEWSDWRRVDNSGCDDRVRGNWDDFDDFEDQTERWYAVALYNCGTDGHALSGIRWWDGAGFEDNIIDHFCGNVAGPMADCYRGANTGNDTCDANYGDPYYSYVWIDQNDRECHGVSIATGATSRDGVAVGQVWWKSDPGIPDCSGEIGAHAVIDRDVKVPQDSGVEIYTIMSKMNVLIAVVALLVVANIICVTVAVYRCISNRDRPRYSKVDMDSC